MVPFSMAKNVPLGARASVEQTVEFKHSLAAHHPDLPPVLSTPQMITLMERACFEATKDYCEGDEITVGAAIHVSHLAPTGIGSKVTATAVLEKIEGRFLIMRVTASDEIQRIGEGTISRAFVSAQKFMQKLKKTGENL